jgi:CubicO group peptidase (beta-lactamase class C family)
MLEWLFRIEGPDFEPDHGWAYSNTTYVMLGDVVRQLTGMGFGAFLEREVLRPLGMERSFAPDDFESRDPWLVEGYRPLPEGGFERREHDMLMVGFADGNVSSNAHDLLAWHHWLFGGEGPALVSEGSKRLMLRDRMLADGRRTGYGLGLFLGIDGSACGSEAHLPGHREVWHTGSAAGFVSCIGRFPDEAISVILLCNDERADREGIYTEIARAAIGAEGEGDEA